MSSPPSPPGDFSSSFFSARVTAEKSLNNKGKFLQRLLASLGIGGSGETIEQTNVAAPVPSKVSREFSPSASPPSPAPQASAVEEPSALNLVNPTTSGALSQIASIQQYCTDLSSMLRASPETPPPDLLPHLSLLEQIHELLRRNPINKKQAITTIPAIFKPRLPQLARPVVVAPPESPNRPLLISTLLPSQTFGLAHNYANAHRLPVNPLPSAVRSRTKLRTIQSSTIQHGPGVKYEGGKWQAATPSAEEEFEEIDSIPDLEDKTGQNTLPPIVAKKAPVKVADAKSHLLDDLDDSLISPEKLERIKSREILERPGIATAAFVTVPGATAKFEAPAKAKFEGGRWHACDMALSDSTFEALDNIDDFDPEQVKREEEERVREIEAKKKKASEEQQSAASQRPQLSKPASVNEVSQEDFEGWDDQLPSDTESERAESSVSRSHQRQSSESRNSEEFNEVDDSRASANYRPSSRSSNRSASFSLQNSPRLSPRSSASQLAFQPPVLGAQKSSSNSSEAQATSGSPRLGQIFHLQASRSSSAHCDEDYSDLEGGALEIKKKVEERPDSLEDLDSDEFAESEPNGLEESENNGPEHSQSLVNLRSAEFDEAELDELEQFEQREEEDGGLASLALDAEDFADWGDEDEESKPVQPQQIKEAENKAQAELHEFLFTAAQLNDFAVSAAEHAKFLRGFDFKAFDPSQQTLSREWLREQARILTQRDLGSSREAQRLPMKVRQSLGLLAEQQEILINAVKQTVEGGKSDREKKPGELEETEEDKDLADFVQEAEEEDQLESSDLNEKLQARGRLALEDEDLDDLDFGED